MLLLLFKHFRCPAHLSAVVHRILLSLPLLEKLFHTHSKYFVPENVGTMVKGSNPRHTAGVVSVEAFSQGICRGRTTRFIGGPMLLTPPLSTRNGRSTAHACALPDTTYSPGVAQLFNHQANLEGFDKKLRDGRLRRSGNEELRPLLESMGAGADGGHEEEKGEGPSEPSEGVGTAKRVRVGCTVCVGRGVCRGVAMCCCRGVVMV